MRQRQRERPTGHLCSPNVVEVDEGGCFPCEFSTPSSLFDFFGDQGDSVPLVIDSIHVSAEERIGWAPSIWQDQVGYLSGATRRANIFGLFIAGGGMI